MLQGRRQEILVISTFHYEDQWLIGIPWPCGLAEQCSRHREKGAHCLSVEVCAPPGFGTFLAPFNWIAFVSDSGELFWQILTGFFDVVITGGVGSYLIKNVSQLWAVGNGRISFGDFPFFLGQTRHLTIQRLPADLTTVQLNLRCIEEAYEILEREEGRKRESVVVCYEIYYDTQRIRGELVNKTGDLRCFWNLPNDKSFPSTPNERSATFWELEVHGKRVGVIYHSSFLLPVYAKA